MTDEQPIQLPMAPGAVRSVALAELERSSAFVEKVSLEDWSRNSAASGWTIGDVVAHLALTLGLYGRLISAAGAGRTGKGLWKAIGQLSERVAPATSPALNSINRAIPRLMDRALAPEVIKGQFSASNRTVRKKLEAIQPADYTQPVYYMGSPWPLSFFLAQLVDELALHIWDIASILDPAAHLSEEARSVIPWFFWSGTPFMLRLPKKTFGVVQVSLSDPAAEMWWRLEQTNPGQGAGEADRPDVRISGGSNAYSLVISGRMSLDDALRNDLIKLLGNEQLARDFLGAWRIV